jgi:hypothetical protein
MMRRQVLLPAVAMLLAACAGTSSLRPPRSSPTDAQLEGSSCEEQIGGDNRQVPDFVDVEVASEGGVDRATFRFELNEEGVETPPSYRVTLVPEEQLISDPQGERVEIRGTDFVVVSFQAFSVELSGEEPVILYEGPKEFDPDFPVLLEMKELGDFEALVTWGMGLARRSCPRVTASATELVVEFASP